jgi:hypothetical protein
MPIDRLFRFIISLFLIVTAVPFLASETIAQQDEAGTSSVEVLKRLCPPGYDGANFFEDCPDPQADVQFSLNGLQTTTDAEGSAVFFELTEGSYILTEDSFAAVEYGYDVYCRLAEDVDAVIDFSYVEAGPTGTGIELFVEADTDIICGWYNIPEPLPDPTPTPAVAPDTSSVEVLKRLCPPGYEGGNFFEDCPDPQADVQFSLDGLQTTTDAEGSAVFFELGAGTVRITEDTVPADQVLEYVVYCRLAEDPDAALDFTYVDAGPTGAAIDLNVPAQTDIICGWYNIEVEELDSTVRIHHRICPPDYDGGNFAEDCTNIADPPLPFELSNGVQREQQTDQAGNVSFTGLPSGTYTIIGGAPGHAADLAASCVLPDGSPHEVEGLNGGIQLFVPEQTRIDCNWYNIPIPLNGQSSVEVLKRVCPPGYDGDDYFGECDEPQAGVQFGLDGRQATTDAAGSAIFPELTEGTYTITEDTLSTAEYGYWVYCRLAEDVDAVVEFDYVEAGATGAGIELFVDTATDIICGWYNIPEPLPDPTPTATVTPAPPTPTSTPIPPTPTPMLPTPTPPLELAIHPVTLETGSCPVPGELVVALNDAELREGEEIGFPGPVGVAESVTRLNATIDQLTDQEFIIVVYRSPEEADEVIACGQVGGVPREMDDGGFAIRLGQVDESGALGIADIAPVDDLVDVEEGLGDDEPTIVEITVYLTLIEDDPESAGAAS